MNGMGCQIVRFSFTFFYYISGQPGVALLSCVGGGAFVVRYPGFGFKPACEGSLCG